MRPSFVGLATLRRQRTRRPPRHSLTFTPRPPTPPGRSHSDPPRGAFGVSIPDVHRACRGVAFRLTFGPVSAGLTAHAGATRLAAGHRPFRKPAGEEP